MVAGVDNCSAEETKVAGDSRIQHFQPLAEVSIKMCTVLVRRWCCCLVEICIGSLEVGVLRVPVEVESTNDVASLSLHQREDTT